MEPERTSAIALTRMGTCVLVDDRCGMGAPETENCSSGLGRDMGTAPMGAENEMLRLGLRRCTHVLHDRLDSAIAGDALAGSAEDAAFLQVQDTARRPIGGWTIGGLQSGLRPPAVRHLVVQDLAGLGETLPPIESFRLADDADPIGVAWVIGGSALGNRATLARIRDARPAPDVRFLADRNLAQVFASPLPELAEAAAPDRLSRAVRAAETRLRQHHHREIDPVRTQRPRLGEIQAGRGRGGILGTGSVRDVRHG